MNSRKRVMCALEGGKPDRVPFCENWIDPAIARAVTGEDRDFSQREISDLFNRDIVVAVIFPPYAANLEVGSDGQSYVGEGWIRTRKDLSLLKLPDPDDEALYKEAAVVLAEKGEYATVAAVKLGVAPMLVSMGLDGFSYALQDDPSLIDELLDRYVEWNNTVVRNLIAMGFDFIWNFDDVAYGSGPFCSPKDFDRYFLSAFQRAAEVITIPWVFHSDGNLTPVLDKLLPLGMSAIHPIEPESMNLAEVKKRYGKQVCLIGNVSVDRLSRGFPEDIRAEVMRCLRQGAEGGGYMISASNSIPAFAKPENVMAMVEAIHDFGEYPIRLLGE